MTLGKILIVIGAMILLLGVVLVFAPGLFNWFGRLPGDIRVERERSSFYFPIATMIIVSIILTILLNLLFRR